MSEKQTNNDDLVSELKKRFWTLHDEGTAATDEQAEKLATMLEQIKDKGTQDEQNAVIFANKDYLMKNIFSSSDPAYSKLATLQPSKREFKGGKPSYTLDELMDFANAEKSGEEYSDKDRAKFVSDFEQNKNMSTPQLRLYARTAGMTAPDFAHAIAEKATDFNRGMVSEGYDPSTGDVIPLEKAASMAQGVVLPRTKEAIRQGGSPSTGEVLGDLAEDFVSAIPFGRVAASIPKAGKLYSLLQKSPIGRGATQLAESAAAPVVSTAADAAIYDKGTYRGDKDAKDRAAQIATGTAVNMSLPIVARSLIGRATQLANKGKSDALAQEVVSSRGAVADARMSAEAEAEAAKEFKKPIIYRKNTNHIAESSKGDMELEKTLSQKAERHNAAIDWAEEVGNANTYTQKKSADIDYQIQSAKDKGLIDPQATDIEARNAVRKIIAEFPDILKIMNPKAAAKERLSAMGVSFTTNKMRDIPQFRSFAGLDSVDEWQKKKEEEKKKLALRDYYRQLNKEYENALASKFVR